MEKEKAFFELITIALGCREQLSGTMNLEEWEGMLELAKKHTLVGVLTPALDALPREQKAHLRVYAKWMLETEKIAEKNKAHIEAAKALYETLETDGIRSCILKGQGVAQYYPQPELRQCGDIDIWVDGDRKETLKYFKEHYKTRHIVYHHFDAKVFDDIPVEVHFTPSWMNNSRLNRKLQDYFRHEADKQMGNISPDLGFATPDARFNAVYSAIHIFRHLFFEGIGLRQLMDYRYVLTKLDDNDRLEAYRQLKEIRLGRFTAALMYAMKRIFLLPDEYLLCEPETESGEAFIKEVMLAGNFGIQDERNAHVTGEGLIGRAWRRLARLTEFIKYYPSEVLSAPFFKVWQYFWRRKNHYL